MEQNCYYQSTGQRYQGICNVTPKLQSLEWPLLVAPQKPLNHLLVSNDAIGSSAGPNGQKPCPFVGSSLDFYCSKRYALPPKLILGKRVTCCDNGGVVQPVAGLVDASVVIHLLLLRAACPVAVNNRLVERAPHRLTVSSFLLFPVS